jgi:uncharacterized protein (TIGR02271 family)
VQVDQLTHDQIPELRDIPVYTADGDELGHVGDVYYDENTRRVECVAVSGGFLGLKKRVVPAQGARLDKRGLHLPYSKDEVEGSPDYDRDLDEKRYGDVSRYYDERRTPEDKASVVRKEEELKVGKRPVEAGRARLRKWVETEPVDMDVELKRETARVTREKIDEPARDAEFEEREVDVPLHREEAVVQKQAVAKERVGVEKDVDVETERVRDEVRKERVDVDEDR